MFEFSYDEYQTAIFPGFNIYLTLISNKNACVEVSVLNKLCKCYIYQKKLKAE